MPKFVTRKFQHSKVRRNLCRNFVCRTGSGSIWNFTIILPRKRLRPLGYYSVFFPVFVLAL